MTTVYRSEEGVCAYPERVEVSSTCTGSLA